MPSRPRTFRQAAGVFTIWLVFFSSESFGFNTVKPSLMEWNSLPDHCQVENKTVFKAPPGAKRHKLNKREKLLRWKAGLWHYCTGLVKLMRAERSRLKLGKEAAAEILRDIGYSYAKVNKKHPWSAEMTVAQARVRRLQGNPDEALKILDKLRKHHPRYPLLYKAYAAILFDQKQYAEAAVILAEGNNATGDKIAELQYFLGLAYFNAGVIDKARIYERKAREAKYPLRALTRKLATYDAQNTPPEEQSATQ